MSSYFTDNLYICWKQPAYLGDHIHQISLLEINEMIKMKFRAPASSLLRVTSNTNRRAWAVQKFAGDIRIATYISAFILFEIKILLWYLMASKFEVGTNYEFWPEIPLFRFKCPYLNFDVRKIVIFMPRTYRIIILNYRMIARKFRRFWILQKW